MPQRVRDVAAARIHRSTAPWITNEENIVMNMERRDAAAARLFVLLFALTFGAGAVQAQTTAVCGNTPRAGERIECTEDITSTRDIDIDAADADIDTTLDNEPGVYGVHLGHGNILIDLSRSKITTRGGSSHGVRGNIGQGGSSGDLEFGIRRSAIVTEGDGAHGVSGEHRGGGAGNIIIDVRDSTIETSGEDAYGIYTTGEGRVESHGVRIHTKRTAITTMGDESHGIWARQENTGGNIIIDAEDGSITTNGTIAHGVYGYYAMGEGDILISLRDMDIITRSTLHSRHGDTFSNGVYARHQDTGNIYINIQGGSVRTMGAYSYGVYGALEAAGNGGELLIKTGGGNAIVTTGDYGHGIVAYHHGTSQDTSLISIYVGGSIDVSGAGAQGVRVGRLNNGAPERMAAIGADGYRRQTVIVNGPVRSAAEGVFLAGGGKVVIGPWGSIASRSGIAILASGDTPRLRAGMNPGGRRITDLIGDDWIVNDGGRTTIAVNGWILHDGATGVTGLTAPNGAWNVRMRAEGVRIEDRSDPDPANWIVSERAAGVIGDRDFSAGDFIEVYAPRAAVYEALPGFLLRLDGGEFPGERISSPGSPLWARLSGGPGSYEAERATVGAEYGFSRFAAEAGLDFSLDENATGSVSVRRVRGRADVSAPTGGGKIEADGTGVTLGLSVTGANAHYARGGVSFTSYAADLSSDDLGPLKAGADAQALSLDFESGRRMTIGEKVNLTPRVRLSHTGVDVDDFTDTVDSRVSVGDAARFTGSLGVAVETAPARTRRGRGFSLRGSVDLAQTLDGAETSVDVSGERLASEPAGTRLLLGLGGTYRRGNLSIGADVSSGGLGSGDAQHAALVRLGSSF